MNGGDPPRLSETLPGAPLLRAYRARTGGGPGGDEEAWQKLCHRLDAPPRRGPRRFALLGGLAVAVLGICLAAGRTGGGGGTGGMEGTTGTAPGTGGMGGGAGAAVGRTSMS
jgi:hypothetical protein